MHFTGKILDVNKKKKKILLFLNKTYFTVETYTKNGNGMGLQKISYFVFIMGKITKFVYKEI